MAEQVPVVCDVLTTIEARNWDRLHRYLTVVLNGQRVEIDATFPGAAWDGHSPFPLACGLGEDYPAGDDPDLEKRALEEEVCDPTVREPFIAALTTFS